MEVADKDKVSILEKVFKLSENNTNIKTEILAGLTTFITVAYVLLVIPNTLKASGMNSAGLQGDAAGTLTILNDPIVGSAFASTCIASAIGTFIMAIYANLPIVLAPGIGLTAFFSYSVCLNLGYTWQQGITAVFISGSVFILITLTSIREKIVDALPQNLKLAITAGIGLFISLIGLKSGNIIVSNPGTLVGFGDFKNPSTILTIIGIVIMAILMAKKVKGAMLISMIITTIIGIPMGITKTGGMQLFYVPPIGKTFFSFDFQGLLGHGGSGVIGAIVSIFMVIVTFSLVDLFDSIGTLVGTAQKADMVMEDGKVKNMKQALLSDSLATTMGAMFGTTTLATVVESAAGIAEGGRTGLTSFVVGVLFLVSLFFGGLIGIVPSEATAPALVIVGVLMLGAVKEIDFDDFTEALPAFFTIAIMPFSYSIANGVAAGIIFYPIMKLVTGKYKDVHPIMYVLALLFIFRFVMLPQ
ncbi:MULTISPECIES: NCS2 family permease [Clostridium]|uniref:Guanine/hypoxanthine permease PbuG n=2 Tax=Clostridium TaxID=1485 RepID=A0A151ALW4_9CLOT|nr:MULTISPECIES: NCS2 family permease [Clostridium]KYH28611.1 guanine/hypoxanthine permease PbuG [Clostridium colicanis DSM 13634]MBE6042900.1 NCS2 family permease [Clostridium thermopalmarium]PRR74101.1 Guanine/hypoxanthine permease PbuG [Clostridium thermopalmarium DSM 5974]PVZ25429.1 AGZA family xanthine/uracil permease-like MFS transporter [Clostridium thermopalmarium DSM 5974]